jgi:hypothetical protein
VTEESRTGPPDAAPALFLVKGEATLEEVAALTAVLQAVAAAAAPVQEPGPPVRSEWAAPHRQVRATYPHGPRGWRSSALPR